MKQKEFFLKAAVVLFLFLFVSPVSAENFIQNKDVRAVCEGIMQEVYQEILSQKLAHPELVNFDETAFSEKNQFDLQVIHYGTSFGFTGGYGGTGYGFYITILPTEETLDTPPGFKAFNLSFPVLELKFSGYQGAPGKEFYDIQKAIQKYGIELWDEQQKYLPYKLSIVAVKENFRAGEDIEFIVKLTNDSKANYKLKRLDAKTLYFVFDNKPWGAQELADKETKNLKEILLKPGQTIQKKFRAPGFKKPQTVEIHAAYNFPYKGVKPSAKLTLPIEE